jgi:threonyl-tRNA synthetase
MKNEPYKIELINDLGEGEKISFYTQGDFTDLCAGPHVMDISKIKAVKTAVFYRGILEGHEKNKMLQRIYGVSFPKASELEAHLQALEQAKLRDHNKWDVN